MITIKMYYYYYNYIFFDLRANQKWTKHSLSNQINMFINLNFPFFKLNIRFQY